MRLEDKKTGIQEDRKIGRLEDTPNKATGGSDQYMIG